LKSKPPPEPKPPSDAKPANDLESENADLKVKLASLESEMSLMRDQPTIEETIIFNREKRDFDARRAALLSDIARQQAELDGEWKSLDAAKRSLEQSKSSLGRAQAKFEQESSQLRQERQRFEDLRRDAVKQQDRSTSDAALLSKERAELERQKAEFARELQELEELRDSEVAERQRLEAAQAQFEDLEAKSGDLRRKAIDISRQQDELEKAQAAFASERDEARRIAALKVQLEAAQRDLANGQKSLERDRSAFQKSFSEFNEQKIQIDDDLRRLSAASEDVRKRQRDVDEQLRGVDAAVAKHRADVEAFQEERDRLRPEIEMRRALLDLEGRVAAQRTVIAKLRAKARRAARVAPGNFQSPYLKKVLLQFFLQEASARDALIPVLLKLVECSDEEIQVALRKWNESFQMFSRSFWSF
jgi:chromosome segregation ATPase